jgi:hypothetical protein
MHQGPLTPKDDDWDGSTYNVMIKWQNGEINSKPLLIFATDDPISCALYVQDNRLLECNGWKRFKGIAN